MTEINKTSKISIGLLIVLIPLIASAVIWYDDRQSVEHMTIAAAAAAQVEAGDTLIAQSSYAANRDVEVELIDAKLKLYRVIREHRELTEDEAAEEEWLKERKSILLQEKRERRG